jgi:hypothetical protein
MPSAEASGFLKLFSAAKTEALLSPYQRRPWRKTQTREFPATEQI